MRKLSATLCAAAMAVSAVGTTTIATQAAPVVPQIRSELPTSDVVQVRHNRRGYYRNGPYYYYNGHRGYREYRRGYRRHNDFWFPAGAFIAGALIGGALADPGPRYVDRPRYVERRYYEPRRVYRRAGSSHVEWCYDRYRSYREWDNTYQPYGGPRQQCYSPYN